MAAAVSLLLASCAQYQPHPVSAAGSARALEARTLDNPRLLRFIAIASPRRDETSAPSAWDLNALTLAALYYHPDLDIARARLAYAQAGVTTAAQIPNPVVGLGFTYNHTTATPSPWTAGALVNVLLETFGKRRYRTEEARQLAQAARDDLASASWQVRSGVRSALLGLWASRRQLVVDRRRLALQAELVRLLEQRLAAGAASALQVARERIRRNRIELALRDAERRAAQSRAQLAAAVGISLHALADAKLSLKAFDRPAALPPHIATGTLRREALTRRADVQSVLAQYAAAQSALQLEIARQYPNLALGPGYTYDQGDDKYTLSLASALPIFNQNQGPIAQAKARRDYVAAEFTALQARIVAAIDAAHTSYRTAVRTLDAADTLLAEEKRRQARVVQSFKSGAVDRTALVAAGLDVAAAQLSRFGAAVQERRAIGALEDALQHSLLEPGAALPVTAHNPRLASEPAHD